MFYLHIANRTEELLQQLAAVLQTDIQSPFTKELFLVQSQGMERVVCQGLADSLGIFCNYRFLFPLEFLHFVAEQLGLDVCPDGFDRGSMTWRLEALLRDIESPEYQPIYTYLQGENAGIKRFQLACRLADCFDKYQLMRGEMVLGWDKGQLSTPSDCEKWQMALWQRLLIQGEKSVHQAQLFADITRKLEEGEEGSLSARLPHRISVFGVHTLPPVFFQYLAGFARHGNVHFYLLSPCKEYWGDLKNGKAQIKEILKNRLLAKDNEFVEFTGHPLLASLGQQGRDLQEILAEMDISMEFTSYIDPLDIAQENGRSPRLLEVVQRDLLYGEVSTGESLIKDDSLHIVSCHSKVRELEVLREHILRFLDEDEELQLRQIVVMAPDIQQYTPFISAIFHDIEHSVADRSLHLRNTAIAAFSSFLSLFTVGRFGRSAVLELLQYESVASRFFLSRSDIEKIVQWTEESGIRWGLSASDLRGGDDAFDCGSFRAGLNRLLMGYAIDCDDFVFDMLPFSDIEGKQAQALGGLCQYIEFLEQMAQAFREPRSLGRWRELLLACVERLFAANDSSGEMELRGVLNSLGESERFTGEQDIEFSVIQKWFAAQISNINSSSGFLRGQLTFCSMLPMRSIPFQVVCLLGLNDGVFPQSDRTDTFNLISGFAASETKGGSPVNKHRPGDRSPANDDRYQFLEAILAARRCLYISYIGQSEKSGESEPSSVVVSELLDLLNRGYGVEMKAVEHPLYPFASRYFDNSSPDLFSYSAENLNIAQIRQQSGAIEEAVDGGVFPWWRGEVRPEKESVSVAELTGFYKDPPGWFVQKIAGISLKIDSSAIEDVEMFSVDSLARYKVENALFDKIFNEKREHDKEDREQFFQYSLRSFQQKGEWPLGAPGKFLFDTHLTAVEKLVAQAKKFGLGEKISDLSLDLAPCDETAQLRITGKIPGRYENGNLVVYCGELKGYHLLVAWIYHLLDNFQQQKLRRTWLLTESSYNCFSSLPTDDEPALLRLLQLWKKGCRSPLPLYTEAAFAWAAARTEDAALNAARDRANNNLKYKPEWSLLLGDKEIEESVKANDFMRYAKEVMAPLYTLCKKGGI